MTHSAPVNCAVASSATTSNQIQPPSLYWLRIIGKDTSLTPSTSKVSMRWRTPPPFDR